VLHNASTADTFVLSGSPAVLRRGVASCRRCVAIVVLQALSDDARSRHICPPEALAAPIAERKPRRVPASRLTPIAGATSPSRLGTVPARGGRPRRIQPPALQPSVGTLLPRCPTVSGTGAPSAINAARPPNACTNSPFPAGSNSTAVLGVPLMRGLMSPTWWPFRSPGFRGRAESECLRRQRPLARNPFQG